MVEMVKCSGSLYFDEFEDIIFFAITNLFNHFQLRFHYFINIRLTHVQKYSVMLCEYHFRKSVKYC